jgi:hypothetical protein
MRADTEISALTSPSYLGIGHDASLPDANGNITNTGYAGNKLTAVDQDVNNCECL